MNLRKLSNWLSAAALCTAATFAQTSLQAAPITIDGNIDDWTSEDRLELPPRSPVPGYELSGRYENNAYKILLRKLSGSIGPSTTFWLNTDQNPETGYKIWGYAGGAEYNVNIAADGKPYLYKDADGQTFVSGPLTHSIVADGNGTNMELEIPETLIGSPAGAGINMLIDVNNSTFLPVSYWPHSNNYIIPKQSIFNNGDIQIDGQKSDWKSSDRMDLDPVNAVEGVELYGRYENGQYKLLIHDFYRTIGADTTIWINTDQDYDTGYQIWGYAGGAEYNINFGSDGVPRLYKDADGQTLVSESVNYAITADGSGGSIMELEINEALIGMTNGDAIRLLFDVNDSSFMPRSYWPHTNAYELKYKQSTAQIAIVYSSTSEAQFFDSKAYAQLFMSVQSQAIMAGLPFDLLSEDDLLNLDKITQYKTLVFPYFANVKQSALPGIEQNLNIAVNQHNVGIVTAGNLLTNTETGASLPGDAYSRMKSLMGVTRTDGGGPFTIDYKISNNVHPITSNEYDHGEVLKRYTNSFTDYFIPTGAYSSNVLATQEVAGVGTKNALIVTEHGGRHAHFGTVQQMVDPNILWSVLQWSVYGEKAAAALHMTRDNALFIARNDMDQSMFIDEVEPVDGALLPILQAWKEQYNFIGSYYINIGDYPENQEQTNWNYSAPLYQQYIALGSEMGTHSYTHPHDTNILNPEQISWEFLTSREIIEEQLGLTNLGAAVPGAPENLATSLEIIQHADYLTGGYSSSGAGYPNAFGFLNPTISKVYLSPNMSFDFTLVEFQGRTAEEAKQIWFDEFDTLTSHSPQGLVHWPWHDYGPINWGDAGYNFDMFDSLLKKVHEYGSEFTTSKDFAERIKAFKSAELSVSKSGNVVTANVAANHSGKFALRVAKGSTIKSVDNWYAYNDHQVLLSKAGGQFKINLGEPTFKVSRITKLPSRSELISVDGDGTDLDFEFKGQGEVTLSLKCAPTAGFDVTGGSYKYQFLTPDTVNIIFEEDKQHAKTFVDATCP
ncbi:MAG: hypothetical protein CSB47_08225 [Proteobacteria bacterium]|nr:MAG: hypothetical protein CSB47_08225 [Pseudomonadota bacterium]